MKNDFQILPLQALAQDYQETYTSMARDELRLAKAAARRAYDRRLERTVQNMHDYNGEAGSDGLEEEAHELVGDFKEPTTLSAEIVAKLCEEARAAVVPKWIEREAISQKLTWLPQQMMAYFGGWEAVLVDGVYSPMLTARRNTQERKDLHALGALLFARAKRGDIFKGASKGSQQYKSPINPLVPIVLAGFKRYQGIPYEAWNKSELNSIVDDGIVRLIGCKMPSLLVGEVLELRTKALTPATGPRAGKCSNPATTAALYHLQETALGHLPKLAKHMVLQTWAAHPENRDKYAILDLENWDKVPDPLVDLDLFQPQPQPRQRILETPVDVPWV